MKFTDRPIAITDVETSGLDASLHEILEIGLVVVNQKTLKIIDSYSVKVRPTHIASGAKKALAVCDYNERDWRNAVDLDVAMRVYADKTRNAVFCAHNVYFDWSFIARAFQTTGIEDYMDYHRIDLFTTAWTRLRGEPAEKFNLAVLCKRLGVPPEPLPHRAINGARTAHRVLKKLLAE
jgi:DNA polymerase-3 subunit epsilon